MTDLELLIAEVPPRSDATCARLVAKIEPVGGFVLSGILWLIIACSVATLVLLAIAGTRATGPAPPAVLAAWPVAFALAWVPFGLSVAGRRRAARALVRDGALVKGMIDGGAVPRRRTAARFQHDGNEERAIFAVGRRAAVPAEPYVLCAAGRDGCLAFADGGSAVRARLARDVAIAHEGPRVTVTLRRSGLERATAWIVALLLVQLGYLGGRLVFFQPGSELRCDRARDLCTLRGSDIFGSEWSTTFPLRGVTGSEVREREHGELAWVLRRPGGPKAELELGAPTGRGAQKEAYRRQAQELNVFLADSARPSFDARFEALGGPSTAVWLLVGIFFVYVLGRLVHGWRTTLVVDRAAGEITITRSPALLPPGRRALALAAGTKAEAKPGGLWLLFSYLPTVTLRLVDDDGNVLFKRRQIDAASVARAVAAINELLAGS
jgi:hypothetical protein